MNFNIIFYILLTVSFLSHAQDSIDELLSIYNTQSIPYISVKELKNTRDTVLVFDAREEKEYQVSHLQNAIHVGYTGFSITAVEQKNIPKNTPIVVYCSLGVRSEDISEKLKKAGFTHVYNLHGGIFSWKNEGFPIVNSEKQPTNEVHVYSQEWSKWLHNGKKIY